MKIRVECSARLYANSFTSVLKQGIRLLELGHITMHFGRLTIVNSVEMTLARQRR